MTLRPASGLAAGLARLIGLARGRRRPRPAQQRPDPVPYASAGAARRSRYIMAPPLLRCLGGWSVHNHASHRVIAAGLSRAQAETLCLVLDRACEWSRNSPTDAVYRKEEE
jgi:hypothetical protein